MPKKQLVVREKVAFRLARDVTKKLRETAARLDVSQAKVLEFLVRKHADALRVE